MGESEPTKNLLKSFLQYPLPQTGHFLRFVASIDQIWIQLIIHVASSKTNKHLTEFQ